jgi:hypothetical protein
MITISRIIILFALLLYIEIPGYTQSSSSVKPNIPRIQTQIQETSDKTSTVNNQEIQIAVLKSQVESSKQYDQSLLATIHWALGGVLAIMGVIVALNWFYNYANYAREKEAIYHEITREVSKSIAELQISIASSIENKVKRDFDSKIELVKMELLHEKVDVKELQTTEYITRGVYANAIRAQCEIVNICKEYRGLDYRIVRSLDKIIEGLEELKSTDFPVTTELLQDISDSISGLPESMKASVDHINDLLSKLIAQNNTIYPKIKATPRSDTISSTVATSTTHHPDPTAQGHATEPDQAAEPTPGTSSEKSPNHHHPAKPPAQEQTQQQGEQSTSPSSSP